MTENTNTNQHCKQCNCSCSCCGQQKKHCTWGTVAVGLALFFSLVALATSLCAVHKDDRDDWHHRGHYPMMQGWERGVGPESAPGGPRGGWVVPQEGAAPRSERGN